MERNLTLFEETQSLQHKKDRQIMLLFACLKKFVFPWCYKSFIFTSKLLLLNGYLKVFFQMPIVAVLHRDDIFQRFVCAYSEEGLGIFKNRRKTQNFVLFDN